MKFIKIGMRTWEKETHPIPGPEFTSQTLIILKMMNIIDKGVDDRDDKIEVVKSLLALNHKLNKVKK